MDDQRISFFFEIADREYVFLQILSKDFALKVKTIINISQMTMQTKQKSKIKLTKLQHHQDSFSVIITMQPLRTTVMSEKLKSRTRSIKLVLHFDDKRARLQSDQVVILEFNIGNVQLVVILNSLQTVTVACNSIWNMHCHANRVFVLFRHNHIRNITASLLIEVCKDAQIKPPPQQLVGEIL